MLRWLMQTLLSPPCPPRDDDIVIPFNERKTMTTLLPNDCRWPLGDPQLADFYFCGKGKVAGHSYCEFHVRRGKPSKPRPIRYQIAW